MSAFRDVVTLYFANYWKFPNQLHTKLSLGGWGMALGCLAL